MRSSVITSPRNSPTSCPTPPNPPAWAHRSLSSPLGSGSVMLTTPVLDGSLIDSDSASVSVTVTLPEADGPIVSGSSISVVALSDTCVGVVGSAVFVGSSWPVVVSGWPVEPAVSSNNVSAVLGPHASAAATRRRGERRPQNFITPWWHVPRRGVQGEFGPRSGGCASCCARALARNINSKDHGGPA
jgi:hypothetical protein